MLSSLWTWGLENAQHLELLDLLIGLPVVFFTGFLTLRAISGQIRARKQISLKLQSDKDGKELLIPYQPRRDSLSRGELYGAIGTLSGSRRFDGQALTATVMSNTWGEMLDGKRNSLEFTIPDREFQEFAADLTAFETGKPRVSPFPPAQRRDSAELQAIKALAAQVEELQGEVATLKTSK